MSKEIVSFHDKEAAMPPTPEMLQHLARAAFEYGLTSDKLEVVQRESIQPVYYLKDFQLENGDRIGRVARFSSEPLLEVEFEDEGGRPLVGVANTYSFYYSERVEREGHGLREEWQAFGYKWNDNDEVQRAARWVESHPNRGQPRTMSLSTASDVSGLIRDFQTRQQSASEAA